jgi:hypothetical protein
VTQWIAQIDIEAECILPDGVGTLEYSHPDGSFKVRLTNKKVCPIAESPVLDVHLLFEAEDIEVAHKRVKPMVRQFLRWLTFTTHCGFKILAVNRLIDWTPGLSMRDQFIYHADLTDMPPPAISEELLQTISLLNQNALSPDVNRALRWFANGVAAELMDDQFQCFFFALEILAQVHKSVAPVPDKCPRCQTPLFCEKCEEVPMHRPYAKQAVQQLIEKIAPTWVGGFETMNVARNGVMHGETIEEIESRISLPFDDLVDRAGQMAWVAIMNSIQLPAGKNKLALAQASTFIRRSLVARFRMQMGSLGDPNNPTLESQPMPEVTVESVPRAGSEVIGSFEPRRP